MTEGTFSRELLAGKNGCSFFLGIEAGTLTPKESILLPTKHSEVSDAWCQPNPKGGQDVVFAYRRHYFGSRNCSERFIEFLESAAVPLGTIAIIPYMDLELTPVDLFRHHRTHTAKPVL